MKANMVTIKEVGEYKVKSVAYAESYPYVFQLIFTHDELPAILVTLKYLRRMHPKGIYRDATARGWEEIPMTMTTIPVERAFKARAISFVESVVEIDESEMEEDKYYG